MLERPNKHTTNDTIKNNTTKADGNVQRNGMTHARNKYKTKLIFHVNRNSSLLEPTVQINFNGGEKMESNSWVGNVIMTIDSNTHQHNDFIEIYSC